MSKSTVTAVTATIKKLADYNITDTDLDDLILEALNLFLPMMKQWFMDDGLFDEIGAHDTLTTVANQEYIDIAAETVDFDQHIQLTERTNDSPIELIPFAEYRQRFPDPTVNKSQTPDVAAFFSNRLYLGPTPSGVISIFLDYIALTTILTSGSTLPYEHKYNALVVAGATEYLVKWLDRGNQAAIASAEKDTLKIKHQLITAAAKNIGMNQQVHSRREGVPYFSPRRVIT